MFNDMPYSHAYGAQYAAASCVKQYSVDKKYDTVQCYSPGTVAAVPIKLARITAYLVYCTKGLLVV